MVYSKRPFGGAEHALRYLGCYTHRVAISNHRLVALEDGEVVFRWRDSAHKNKKRLMRLALDEFLRRFFLTPHGRTELAQTFLRVTTGPDLLGELFRGCCTSRHVIQPCIASARSAAVLTRPGTANFDLDLGELFVSTVVAHSEHHSPRRIVVLPRKRVTIGSSVEPCPREMTVTFV